MHFKIFVCLLLICDFTTPSLLTEYCITKTGKNKPDNSALKKELSGILIVFSFSHVFVLKCIVCMCAWGQVCAEAGYGRQRVAAHGQPGDIGALSTSVRSGVSLHSRLGQCSPLPTARGQRTAPLLLHIG